MEKKNIETILAIMAHPGDAAVLCAGTLARFARQGSKIAWACISSGAGGNKFIPTSQDKLAALRHAHEQAAARLLIADLHWLGLADGMLWRSDDYILKLVDLIREIQPSLIITHHPEDYHCDNQAVSKATFVAAGIASIWNIKSARPASDRRPALFYAEGWISRSFMPTDYVDITATYSLKTKAIRANKIGVQWLRKFDKMDIFDLVQTTAKNRGFQCGCTYAEAFKTDPYWPQARTQRLLP